MSLIKKLVLVTPNISEQMGGEAIKAFQFLRHLHESGVEVSVITHRRSAEVFARNFGSLEVFVVEDSLLQRLIWWSVVLRPLISSVFFFGARRHVRAICQDFPDAIFHYLCPVSPILLRFPVRSANNVLGPLTGNIYYPPAFRSMEPLKDRFRRIFHYVAQRLLGALARDKRLFRRVLVSGGARTRDSLVWAGCHRDSMLDVVDSGVSAQFDAHPLIHHDGMNLRFMTSGRLVPHKGVQLSIEALRYVTQPVQFDVYGDGYYGNGLRDLAVKYGVADKVRFLGWLKSHDALIGQMAHYRGYLVPSLAEANGIVVQEAMMAGLPVVCLKWGGPAMLADENSAILIDPQSRDQVVREIAAALDRLAIDPDHANFLAKNARETAERRYRWYSVIEEWRQAYD